MLLIWGLIKNFIAAAIKYWYITLAVIILAIGYYLWSGWNGEKKRGAEAIAAQGQTIANEKKTEANAAVNSANDAVQTANNTRNANFSNTSLANANRLRCEAFPESKECQ